MSTFAVSEMNVIESGDLTECLLNSVWKNKTFLIPRPESSPTEIHIENGYCVLDQVMEDGQALSDTPQTVLNLTKKIDDYFKFLLCYHSHVGEKYAPICSLQYE